MTAMRLWSEVWRHSDTTVEFMVSQLHMAVPPRQDGSPEFALPHTRVCGPLARHCARDHQGRRRFVIILVEKLGRDLRDWPAGRTSGAVSEGL